LVDQDVDGQRGIPVVGIFIFWGTQEWSHLLSRHGQGWRARPLPLRHPYVFL
jgi:hypothetical protein